MQPLDLLKQYWNFDSFRHPQEEIINTVLAGNDAFALMPTGGGKSVCFQIPGLAKNGICLVISPLVALMKDQVANLQSRGIKAIALTGGISVDETSDLLDNCRFGNYKFLYLSPERLQSDWIVDRLKSLEVNLIAVDEAHCISQWGHDFRPAFLKIGALREHFPKVPLLAVTASATAHVQQDIIDQLRLKNAAVFKSSFERKNLAYFVTESEDKLYRIAQIMEKTPGASIIYVRNRKSCIDTSAQLNAMGIPATFYHGGLAGGEKEKNMKRWLSGESRVIVATNAFGMGIDRPDVRSVIHIQLPENLENYYQEAGRAGRDGSKAFAVLILSPSDAGTAKKQFLSVLPDKAFLKTVYIKLCNYLQIAYGEAPDGEQSFNIGHFCQQYDFHPATAYNALQFLDRQGVISLEQGYSEKLALQFIVPSKEVIRYMSLNRAHEEAILTVLRTYPGIYDQKIAVNPSLIARKSNVTEEFVYSMFEKLRDRELIDMTARGNDTMLTLNEVREDDHTINRIAKYLIEQNKLKISQLDTVLQFVTEKKQCLSRIITLYFGAKDTGRCGICSNCIKLPKTDLKELQREVCDLLAKQRLTSREIEKLTGKDESDVIFVLQEMTDEEIVIVGPDNRYQLK